MKTIFYYNYNIIFIKFQRTTNYLLLINEKKMQIKFLAPPKVEGFTLRVKVFFKLGKPFKAE